MASTRRLGAVNSETRSLLIDTAAKILNERGAAAVTARYLAEKVGLQRHIVHYYFGTIEDLFVAILERDTARTREWLSGVIGNEDTLRVIWALSNKAAAITLEFSALAARSVAIREQYNRSSEEFRNSLADALERHLKAKGIVTKLTPLAITLALQGIAYTISIEKLLGITAGHGDVEKHMNELFAALMG